MRQRAVMSSTRGKILCDLQRSINNLGRRYKKARAAEEASAHARNVSGGRFGDADQTAADVSWCIFLQDSHLPQQLSSYLGVDGSARSAVL